MIETDPPGEAANRSHASASEPKKSATLITDGGCIGNPGQGGWACILRYGRHKKEIFGSEPHTTNNRMELTAVIRGLQELKEACQVTLITDSQYVKNGITQWIHRWKKRGWKTSGNKPVLDQDLWLALDQEIARHHVRWEWVKGHADHADNNRADELANEAARQQIRSGAG